MSYRLKLTVTITLLIAVAFGIGGTLMITTSFQASLETETQSALEAFESIQNTLFLLNSLGDQTDFESLVNALEQMSEQNMGNWQGIILKDSANIIFQDGNQEELVLRTEGLVKTYGKRTVVNNVSFEVRQGEIVGLLGPNGAGKTTSFYMTTGLVVPNAGRIFIGNLEITKDPVYKRARNGIGYLAQEASVFRKMTVEDNIASVLEMTGKPKEYQKEKLESLIAEFSLQKVRKNYGDRLSGGERRRTEIARCLAIDPKFIMLDEPFAGVDPIAVEDIQYIVWKLKQRNIGVLITDHNVEDTLCITDRAYMLFEGQILFQGTPQELSENEIVRAKYLTNSFVLRLKDFQKIDQEKSAQV